MTPILDNCPHCGSPAKFVEKYGSMKSFPAVIIACTNKECLGNMHVTYDEFSGIDSQQVMRKAATCWNKRFTALDNVLSKIKAELSEQYVFLNVGDKWQNGDEYGTGFGPFIIGSVQTGIKEGDTVDEGSMCYLPRRKKKK